jgi:hypothetical protein
MRHIQIHTTRIVPTKLMLVTQNSPIYNSILTKIKMWTFLLLAFMGAGVFTIHTAHGYAESYGGTTTNTIQNATCVTLPAHNDGWSTHVTYFMTGQNYARTHPGASFCFQGIMGMEHERTVVGIQRKAAVFGMRVERDHCEGCVRMRFWEVWGKQADAEGLAKVAREHYIPRTTSYALGSPSPEIGAPIRLAVHWRVHNAVDTQLQYLRQRPVPTWAEIEACRDFLRKKFARKDVQVTIYTQTASAGKTVPEEWAAKPGVTIMRDTDPVDTFHSLVEAEGLIVSGMSSFSWWASAVNRGQVWQVGDDGRGLRLSGFMQLKGESQT